MTTHAETPLQGSTHSWNTRAVHAGKDDLAALGLHAPPIDLSTTYPSYDVVGEAERLDEFAAGHDDGGPPVYGRVANPTVRRFENALAELEGAEAAVAFASGMAALSACPGTFSIPSTSCVLIPNGRSTNALATQNRK